MGRDLGNVDDLRTQTKRLYSLKGYFERFFELLPAHGSSFAAFEAVEREFYAIFGANRYNSYESFKVAKRRYVISLRKR